MPLIPQLNKVLVFPLILFSLPGWMSAQAPRVSPQSSTPEEYHAAAVEAFNSGYTRGREGDKRGAIELYRKALAREPKMKPALKNLTLLYLELEDLPAAEGMAQNWAAAEPDSADVHQIRAHLALKRHEYEESRRLLKRALSLETDPAKKEGMEKNLASLETYFSQAAERDRNPSAIVTLTPGGEAGLGGQESLERSDSSLEAILRVQESLKGASEALSRQDYQAATSILAAALQETRLPDQRQQVLFMLGTSYFAWKKWDESRRFLNELLTLDPNNPEARDLLQAIGEIAP
jgi:tetratricopeptide (TPR) repeat protein